MTPGDVFDGIVEGAGTGGSDEELGCDPLDPEEEPGSEGLVEDGGGVVGSGLDGGVEGSVGFVDSDGSVVSVGSVGSVGSVDSVGSVVVGGSVVSDGAADGDLLGEFVESNVASGLPTDKSEPVSVVILTEFAAISGDDSAAEAGRMPREPTSIRVPAMAAQRRVERWFEYGAVARIRLLHWSDANRRPTHCNEKDTMGDTRCYFGRFPSLKSLNTFRVSPVISRIDWPSALRPYLAVGTWWPIFFRSIW